MVKVKENLTGWVMSEHGVPDSKLTVIQQTDDYVRSNGSRSAQWLCECSCEEHNKVVVRGDHIKRGKVKSCGCVHKQIAKELGLNSRKYNKYDLSGKYGILWTTNTDEVVCFDLDDAERILQHSWYKDSEGYASTHINKTHVRMHTFLGYFHPDHHDRNKLNNCKTNLFSCTFQENARNASCRTDNTSGVIGVYLNYRGTKWVAQINNEKNKTKNLGSFLNKDDTIIVRLKAEAQYYGEFAPQRHLFEKYGINFDMDGDII